MHLIRSLFRSLEDNPRAVTVYYCGIKESTINYLNKTGRFKLIGEEELGNINTNIYSVQ